MPLPRPRIRMPLALLALALVFPVITLTPATTAPARAADPSITFEGGGWGHAVGLSQYGAYGMALLDGADAEAILTHYYQGTELATLGRELPAADRLRVNLVASVAEAKLRPTAIAEGGATFTVVHDRTSLTARAGDLIAIEVTGSANGEPTCRLQAADVSRTGTCKVRIEWDGDDAEPTSRLTIEETKTAAGDPGRRCTNPDWNAIPTTFRPCSYAYGSMHVIPAGNDRFHLVLDIDVDRYVEGISEMPYHWASPDRGPNGVAALEAQAIAARSYAVSRQIARGDPDDRNCKCDVVDTAVDQRYVGWGHTGLGHEAWTGAARRTAGTVLTHPEVAGGGQPITAYYGSSSYGTTESGLDGFALALPYLQSVDDHWATDPAVRNPYATWSKTMTGADLAAALGHGDDRIVRADVTACSESGAALQVRFVGDSGAEHLRAARDLRSVLGLRSPQITSIDGVDSCNAEPAALVPAGVTIDDNATGDSVGNGDGRAQCGETVEVTTVMRNGGDTRASNVTASLSVEDPAVSIAHNSTSPVGDIAPGARAGNRDDWDLVIAEEVPDGHRTTLAVEVTYDGRVEAVLAFPITVECAGQPPAEISVASVTIDDGIYGDSVGNNDRIAQCGETIELYVELQNRSSTAVHGLTATVIGTSEFVSLLHNAQSSYPDLEPGSSAENVDDWDLAVADMVSGGEPITVVLQVTGAGIDVELTIDLEVECAVAPPAPRDEPIVTVDDGPTGDSIGNGDGIAQCGETVELRVALANDTGRTLTDVRATFVPVDPVLTLLHNAESPYPDIAAGGTASNSNDWDVLVGPVADATEVVFRLRVRHAGGAETWRLRVPIECNDGGSLSASSITVDDGVFGDSVGNNNRIAECGETIELYVELRNISPAAIDGFSARLATDEPYLTLLYNADAAYSSLESGGSAENQDDWDFAVSTRVPDRHVAVVALDVTSLGVTLEVPVTIRCRP